jgi:hypothetical protein
MSKKFWGLGNNRAPDSLNKTREAENKDIETRQQKGLNPLTEEQQNRVLSGTTKQGFKNISGLGLEGTGTRVNDKGASTLSSNYQKANAAPVIDISSNSAYRQQMALRKSQQSTRLGG